MTLRDRQGAQQPDFSIYQQIDVVLADLIRENQRLKKEIEILRAGVPGRDSQCSPTAPTDGGSAFPYATANRTQAHGMTLRDYFASHAMQALVSTRPWDEQPSPMVFAEWAYGVADAMLIQRDRK